MTNTTISVSRKGDGWAVDVMGGGDPIRPTVTVKPSCLLCGTQPALLSVISLGEVIAVRGPLVALISQVFLPWKVTVIAFEVTLVVMRMCSRAVGPGVTPM